MSHFKEICKYGFIHRQCKCISNNQVMRRVDCTNPTHAAVKRDFFQWQSIYKVHILDPDGWRQRDGVDFSTPITFDDYIDRVNLCTINTLDSGLFDL